MKTMIKSIILLCLVLSSACTQPHMDHVCVTGYMTEVQSWVDEKGSLIVLEDYDRAIDLSANLNSVRDLQQKLITRDGRHDHVKYLSMARCRLTVVPEIFQFRDSKDQFLADTVEYITFYGNDFSDISLPGLLYDVTINATKPRENNVNVPFKTTVATWSRGFDNTYFSRLKELDLRSCNIQILADKTFKNMPKLEALYIGENEVVYIDNNAFAGLSNLRHLDFSMNQAFDEKGLMQELTIESYYLFETLKNLMSLDMSFTKLTQKHIGLLRYLGPKLIRLSLCQTSLTNLDESLFNTTSLRILDLSGNNGILKKNSLRGLEDTLQILYARDTGLRTMKSFLGFENLKVLDLSMNEIAEISLKVMETLTNLQILDLDMNRVTTWFTPTFTFLTSLKLLSLRDNNINVVSEEMIDDISNVNFLAMSGNFIVCNCHTRDFIDMAYNNEKLHTHTIITEDGNDNEPEFPIASYHRAFIEFNMQIINRPKVYLNSSEEDNVNEDLKGNFLVLDYYPGAYMCLKVAESRSIEFSQVDGCNRSSRDLDYDTVMEDNKRILFVLFVIPGIMTILALIYVFRRNLRYCMITIKNSTLLSLINKHDFVDENTIFHYDVFVSYCNEDRHWVLEHLLPHLESDCSISACLHERDFQVGHSILENIVSCMDRSRSIMLVFSQRFLLSQWCQFEMHLAQHRLLETRRERLTLVLLEEIPRRLRTNTLHYLMLTKTYIIWPKEKSEQSLFWRRIKKTLIKQKQSSVEGVSFA